MHHDSQGSSTRQGHKGIPEGHFEEEQGAGGFFGPVSHLIRPKPITRWTNIEGDLKPRLFDLVEIKNQTQLGSAQRLFYNSDCTISNLWLSPQSPDALVARRNADGDWLYFCHQGQGQMLTEYGVLDFAPGTYINVPKCLTHAFLLEAPAWFLLIENRSSHFREPDRGILGRNAIYDANAIGKPNLEMQIDLMQKKSAKSCLVEIKRLDAITRFTYDENIFDVVGWKGDLYPFTLKMEHLNPVMSHRVHLPPSVHTTFVASGFIVCSFLPRPLEQDEDALRVPFYHQNTDYDEILFYHAGDFFSRDNLHAGMLSFHPAGFPHGPHPKAIEKIKSKTHTDEYAVMIDSRLPLLRDPILQKVEREDYWKSWMKK